MANNRHQRIIADILGTKPIAFNADLARVLGSAKAGLLLSQLLYWYKKGSNPEWIYKTIDEMKKETALSRNEQSTAIKICKNFRTLEMKIKGIPAKRHFKVNIEEIVKLLESSLTETNNQVCKKSVKEIVKITQTNTKNTPKNTNREALYKSDGLCFSNHQSKKKPYYRGEEMRWSRNKLWVIPKEGGSWLEFAGEEKDIEFK